MREKLNTLPLTFLFEKIETKNKVRSSHFTILGKDILTTALVFYVPLKCTLKKINQ